MANEFSKVLNVVSYSISSDSEQFNSFIKAINIEYGIDEMRFDIVSSWGEAKIRTKLYGSFNVSNLLAVLGVLLTNDIGFEEAVDAIKQINTVSGRMEFIGHAKINKLHAPAVVVDYAHTPQALENVLKVLRTQCKGRLHCVFGCGGDRDQGKREVMAQAVERFADNAIVTDDNPRFENPNAITSQIVKGFSDSYSYEVVHNRYDAIKRAIEIAKPEDTVLIAGKGHEAFQIIRDEKLPFDDKKIVKEVLELN